MSTPVVHRFGRRRSAVLLPLALAAAATITIHAHEIGTTRVAVTFPRDGIYRVEVVTDAMSLLEKLEAAARQPRSGTSNVEDLKARLRADIELLSRRIAVAFDGDRVQPEISVNVVPSTDVGGVPGATLVVGSSRVDLQACKLEYSIVSPK